MFVFNSIRFKQIKQNQLNGVRICQQRYDKFIGIYHKSKGDTSSHLNHKKDQSFQMQLVVGEYIKFMTQLNLKQSNLSQIKQTQNKAQRISLKRSFPVNIYKVQKTFNQECCTYNSPYDPL
ncbi:hypothetical protein ABPG74_019322 [Tetrahymena malaccensis]